MAATLSLCLLHSTRAIEQGGVVTDQQFVLVVTDVH